MSLLLSHIVLDSPAAVRTALVLHGALGSGQNFRSFIKRLQQARPDYRFVLVDLRAHGSSNGAAAPHTLSAAAADLDPLITVLGSELPTDVIIGHSLGGKTTLEFARQQPQRMRQLWILDSNPGAQPPHAGLQILQVLSAVRAVPMPAATRQAVVNTLLEQGLSTGIANWMTTNLKRVADAYQWTFELDAIGELVTDYFQQDLWHFLEQPRSQPAIEFVVADESDRIDAVMRQRLQALPASSLCHVHVLPNSGHWVHVDNPDDLLKLMGERLLRD
jgi:esterase